MKPKVYLKKLMPILLGSLINLGLAIYLYPLHLGLTILGFIFVVINTAILLRTFSISLQLSLASQVKQLYSKNPLFYLNILLGVVLTAFMIYLFFLIVFNQIIQIVNTITAQ